MWSWMVVALVNLGVYKEATPQVRSRASCPILMPSGPPLLHPHHQQYHITAASQGQDLLLIIQWGSGQSLQCPGNPGLLSCTCATGDSSPVREEPCLPLQGFVFYYWNIPNLSCSTILLYHCLKNTVEWAYIIVFNVLWLIWALLLTINSFIACLKTISCLTWASVVTISNSRVLSS